MLRMSDAASGTRRTEEGRGGARCPYCAYDLSGTAPPGPARDATFVCPECGRSFVWERSRRAGPAWLYECADRWWDVRSAWSTLFRLLLLRGFWRSIDAGARVLVSRLALGPLLVCASTYGASLLLVYPMVFAAHAWGGRWLPDLDAMEVSLLVAHQFGAQWERDGGWAYNNFSPSWAIVSMGAFTLGAALAAWVMMRLLGASASCARWARVIAYSLCGAAALYVLHAACWTGVYAVWTWSVFRSGFSMHEYALTRILFATLRHKNDVWLILAGAAWLWAFWWFAVRDGLGARRAWLVWVAAAAAGTAFAVCASPVVLAHILL